MAAFEPFARLANPREEFAEKRHEVTRVRQRTAVLRERALEARRVHERLKGRFVLLAQENPDALFFLTSVVVGADGIPLPAPSAERARIMLDCLKIDVVVLGLAKGRDRVLENIENRPMHARPAVLLLDSDIILGEDRDRFAGAVATALSGR